MVSHYGNRQVALTLTAPTRGFLPEVIMAL
jgi:hypothetical protein